MERKAPLSEQEIAPGAFCLAPFSDAEDNQTYYRARIRALGPGKRVLVYYVDYGNSSWVRERDLRTFTAFHLNAGVHKQPCLAVECRLALIKPSIVYGSIWHDAACRKFSSFVNNRQFDLRYEIYCIVKSVVVGTLYGVEKTAEGSLNAPRLNVNEKLIEDGFADSVPENYICQLNFKARERFDMMRRDKQQIDSHNQGQICQMTDISYISPPTTGTISVELKGPWSPLELEFMSLCHSSSTKQVNIDDGSVNSVALDHEPTAPTSRLVVASSVSIQDKSGRVVARDTTMMPAIPGLMALMAMVFAPRIELRVDQNQTRYTGVLCGLGTDPEYQAAVYQDHDVEIVFDTEFDDKDIFEINTIRYHMNHILRGNKSANMVPLHKKVVEGMFALMKRTRKRMEEEIWPQEIYAWNKVSKEFLIPPSTTCFPCEHQDIFLPHSTVALNNSYSSVVDWQGMDY